MAETKIDSPPTDPDDPDHPWNRVQQSIADLRECSVSRELRSLERAWLAGSTPALADAVALCGQHARPLPDGATDGVQRALARVPGNNAGKLDVHYTRWDAVTELPDGKEELSLRGYKPTWEANATEMLAETPANGDAETFRKSYQLIQRLFKSGRGARL